jgi:predicted O-methyltransferase YrrM
MTAQELLDHLTAIKELHNLSEFQVVFEDHDNSLNVQYFNVYSARIKIVDKELILT